MSIVLQLSSLALRGAGHATAAVTGVETASRAGDAIVAFLTEAFSDPSQRLPRSLDRAADRAWRAVELALAGHSWWDRCKATLATAEVHAFREQVQAFLRANPLDGVDGFGPDFRAQCLAQLQAARKTGLLKKGAPAPDQLAHHVGDLSRFGDPQAVVEAQFRCLARIAAQLREHGYDALATFLELRPASGPPLLASAVHYFFQREVEKDKELFQRLAYTRLEGIAQGQSAGFSSLAEALDAHGERLESLLADVHAVVVQTRDDVLDIKAEMRRHSQQMRELSNAVLNALQPRQLERRALNSGDSLSIRDDKERRLVTALVRRYRALPAEERLHCPALLNAVGKLELATGEFESAERDFREVAGLVGESPARAEAAHNAYLAALERRAWPDALTALEDAARLDPARFAPFPLEKFAPERILGAGGFGVAFLCRNTRSGGRVVVKTLRGDGLDRDLGEVFREAQILEDLEHPAIIRVRDCDYADASRSRPYLVMDFFDGQTLAEYVEQNGPLSVAALLPLARLTAEGLHRAHKHGILHRDVKPANLLVRPSSAAANRWDARLIDFGLATAANTEHDARRASLDGTRAGASLAGTIDYAAPEQMGKLKGVPVGTCSDVHSFGKTCCFALFGTPQPTFQHWQQLPPKLADLLGRCLNEQPGARPRDFAAVLRELDGLTATRTRAAPSAPLMDAQPVDEKPEDLDLPLTRIEEGVPVAPPRRRSWPAAGKREEPLRPKRRGGKGMLVAALVGGVVLTAAAVGFFFTFSGKRPPAQVSTQVDSSPIESPLHPTVTLPGQPRGKGVQPVQEPVVQPAVIQPAVIPRPIIPPIVIPPHVYHPTRPAGKPKNPPAAPPKGPTVPPIDPAEFKTVLAELEMEPSLDRLRELARRLAATPPTQKQKGKHAAVEKARRLSEAGPGKVEQARREAEDAVLQVSRGLNRLLGKEVQAGDLQLAAQALQRWGTAENVESLIGALRRTAERDRTTRMELCAALAEIGDERAIAPMAGLLPGLTYYKDLAKMLARFGPKAEPEVLKYIDNSNVFARWTVCDTLKVIGTSASIEPLKRAAMDQRVKHHADAALEAVQARNK